MCQEQKVKTSREFINLLAGISRKLKKKDDLSIYTASLGVWEYQQVKCEMLLFGISGEKGKAMFKEWFDKEYPNPPEHGFNYNKVKMLEVAYLAGLKKGIVDNEET